MVGKQEEKENPQYGHVAEIPYLTFGCNEIDEGSLKQTNFSWTKDGVELIFSSGHKLFIPKDYFIGR